MLKQFFAGVFHTVFGKSGSPKVFFQRLARIDRGCTYLGQAVLQTASNLLGGHFHDGKKILIQVILLGLLLLIIYFGILGFARSLSTTAAGKLRRGLAWFGLLVLIGLIASGRLGWLIPLAGGVIALMTRLLPLLQRLLPLLLELFRGAPHAQAGAGESGPNSSHGGKMSRDEAWQILGLKPGAPREKIIEAHRRLMLKVHPDRGGSDYLAAKLNQARDTLLDGR